MGEVFLSSLPPDTTVPPFHHLPADFLSQPQCQRLAPSMVQVRWNLTRFCQPPLCAPIAMGVSVLHAILSATASPPRRKPPLPHPRWADEGTERAQARGLPAPAPQGRHVIGRPGAGGTCSPSQTSSYLGRVIKGSYLVVTLLGSNFCLFKDENMWTTTTRLNTSPSSGQSEGGM
jgi:hypothetical protein